MNKNYNLRRKRAIKIIENVTNCDILNLYIASLDIKNKYGNSPTNEVLANYVNNFDIINDISLINTNDCLTTMCIKRLKEVESYQNSITDDYTLKLEVLDIITLGDIMLFDLLPLQVLLTMEYKYDTGIKLTDEEYIAFDYLRTLVQYYIQITQPLINKMCEKKQNTLVKIPTMKGA